ncbi:MAG: Snf7 family protein [Candidatus Bathyarchaeia archaeon]
MSSKFAKKWEEGELKGIRGILNPSEPLKNRVELAIKRIENQIQYIKDALNKLSERDRYLFDRIVDAYSKHQVPRARVLANELAEIRKMANFMMSAELALERVVLRLKTMSQLGNVVSALAPAAQVLQNVRAGLGGVLPDVGRELEQIGVSLSDLVIEAGELTGVTPNFEVANDEAQMIIKEAALVAEQKMREKFPDFLPTKAKEGTEESDLTK